MENGKTLTEAKVCQAVCSLVLVSQCGPLEREHVQCIFHGGE